MTDKPRTPASTLQTARNIAIKRGIKYCYVGNVHDLKGQTTYCPNCSKPLIERDWHSVKTNSITSSRCPHCNAKIAGVFF